MSDTPVDMAQVHELMTRPDALAAVRSGHKRHEVRVDDSGFAIGDYLLLREYDADTNTYTGETEMAAVTWITSCQSPDGDEKWCVMSVVNLTRLLRAELSKNPTTASPGEVMLAGAGRGGDRGA